MPHPIYSESVEMYLKSLAEFDSREPVAMARLAERLGVTQVSAGEMVKRLAEQGFVQHIPYKGVVLTSEGQKLANNVIRRQRLWECFLYDHLKLPWSLVYDLACDLEHATASEVTEALAQFLSEPVACPHGNPIPDSAGKVPPLDGIPLNLLEVGQRARVQAVLATTTDVLQYLESRGLLPGVTFTFVEIAPLQGPLILKIGEKEISVGAQIAERVLVKPISNP
ncbi:MAG: metal-dependent transcriptional regulator [Anaerolineales bacterium]